MTQFVDAGRLEVGDHLSTVDEVVRVEPVPGGVRLIVATRAGALTTYSEKVLPVDCQVTVTDRLPRNLPDITHRKGHS